MGGPRPGKLRKFSQTTHFNGQSAVVVRGDRWLFAHRTLIIDWSETRPLVA